MYTRINCQNPFTKVNDKASNYNGTEFSGNNSQGTGFESNSNWTVQTTGFGSASISSNELYSKSFLFTAGFTTGSHTVTISREFDDPMTANDIFSIKFACQDFIDSNANFSIELHDSSDQKLISLSFSYGDTNYTLFDGSSSDTGQSFSADTSTQLKIKYLGGSNYNYSIDDFTSSELTATSSLNDIKKIVIKVENLGYNGSSGFSEFGFDNIEVNASNVSNGETVSVINSDVTLLDLTIDSGGTLIIESDGSLTVNDDLVNNGNIVLNSDSDEYSSLIASSVLGNGTYTYNRFLSDTSTFDIISAPFTGQTFTNLLSNNSYIYSNPNDNTQYAYGPFNNDSGVYVQFDSDSNGNQTMDAGLGYRAGSFNSTELIISEYGEGSSNNKYIEIYNGTGSTVDLTNYSVKLYANANTSPNNTHNFSSGSSIIHGNTYVLYHGSANATIQNATGESSSIANFNGNDALEL